MENFSNKELFAAIILKCADKRSEISERLIKGYWNAIFNKFFSDGDSDLFFAIYDTIKILLPALNDDVIIEQANSFFSDDEKRYCYDVCIDVCAYKQEYSTYKETLKFTTKIAHQFNLSIPKQVERLKLLSVPEVSDCIVYTSRHNFAMIIPETWEIRDNGDDKTKVVALRRNLTNVDTFAENINVVFEHVYNLDFDTYIKLSKSNLAKSFSEYMLIHEWEFDFQNGTGYYLEYAFKMEESGILNSRCYIFINKNIAYIISCLATEDSAPYYAEIFDEISKSFILIN